MQLLSLVSLWFGLSLPVIVLMYLLKRKYVDTEVSSHLLWKRVLRNLEANRPWQRLRNHLLLILQLLAAALLVFALLQPVIWGRQQVKEHLVLIMDRSASMDTLSGSGQAATRLEAAKERAIALIKEEASRSAVTLMTIGAEPEVLLQRELKREAITHALQELEPFYGVASYVETMSLAAAMTQEDPNAEIRVFTDREWTTLPTGITFRTPVMVERVGEAAANDVGIIQFGVKPETSGDVSGTVAVRNKGAELIDTEVTVFADGAVAEVKRVSLPAGGQAAVSFGKLNRAAVYKATIDRKDAFAADNQSFAFLANDRTKKKVLFVTEGNFFLEKALTLSGSEVVKLQAGGTAKVLPPEGEWDLIVLDRISGDAVSDNVWKELLARKPVWYLHSGLAAAKTDVPVSDTREIVTHPVTRYITFADTHVSKRMSVEQVPWGQPIVTIGKEPIVFAGTERGQARLLFAFDLHESDLPLRSEFPILVQNALEWLTSQQEQSLGRAVAGGKKEIPVSAQSVSAEWVPVEVAGDKAGIIAAEKQQDGAIPSIQTVPGLPGLYRFVEKDQNGNERKAYLEVVADPKELATGGPKELTFVRTANEADDAAGNASESGKRAQIPLMPWIIVAALLIVLAEWGIYHRGNSI